MKTLLTGFALLAAVFLFSSTLCAAEKQTQVQDQTHQQISSSHVLTQQERNEYQTRMSHAASDIERDRVRNEYQKLITTRTEEQWRSKDQKVTKQPRLPRRQQDDFSTGRGIDRGTGGGRGR